MEPLWLIELLRGTVEAAEVGREQINGVDCVHYDVVTDLGRAAAASTCGMAQHFVPPGTEANALAIGTWDGRHVPADVFIDSAGLVRRINVRGPMMNVTMELFDLGAAID